jgi:tetratricopeptide (TPR) repeat protein
LFPSRWTIVVLVIAAVLPWLVIAFLSASGRAVYGISTPSPESGRAAKLGAGASRPQPAAHAKQGEQLSSTPLPPQPDPQAVAIAEINALADESIEVAQALVEDFPGQADPLGLIGMVHYRRGQTAKALEYWEQALQRDPHRPDLYDAMATVALRKGEFEKAAELCRKGLEKSARMPRLHCQLAEVLNFLGRPEESVSELQVAVKLSPGNGEFHCQLGKTYLLLNDYEKAKLSYETAVKLQPGNISAHYGLSRACAKLGMKDQSKREMAEFQKEQTESLPDQRGPKDGTRDASHCRRDFALTCAEAGTVYLNNGRPEKAEPLFRRGAAADPENTACRIQLAELLYSANRVPETIPIVGELIEIACKAWMADNSQQGQTARQARDRAM